MHLQIPSILGNNKLYNPLTKWLTKEIVNLKNFGHTMCSLENNLNVLLLWPQ